MKLISVSICDDREDLDAGPEFERHQAGPRETGNANLVLLLRLMERLIKHILQIGSMLLK
jgi:hypothetical protein